MALMVDYIQHIRNAANADSLYHRSRFKNDFSTLSQVFKTQVQQTYLDGRLHQTVHIFSSQLAENPSWEIKPTSMGVSVWTNASI